ncbi:MAG: SMP-30/gluconolactonase/LRE family protein [Gammaproteobacteria bacterium]|uniref:SMP-30/gluconolactonase/LRE family protein n=1 Tax=Bradyrhizobium sp. TaxID=376 RepID=UPI003D09740E
MSEPAVTARRLGAALLLCAPLGASAAALEIRGRVVDEAGAAVPYVRINVTGPALVPTTTSVFSAADGRFRAALRDADPDVITVTASRIGWEEAARERHESPGALEFDLELRRRDNVAEQVPASAWIPGTPGDRSFHILINECAGCHQLGAERVKRFARNLDGQPLETRRAAWEAMVQYMREQAVRIGPSGETHLRWGLTADSPDYRMATAPATSFFLPRDMEVVVPYLAEHYPTRFDSLTGYDDVARLGEYGVTADTVIEEYRLPTFGWTREVSIAPGSPYVWFLELDADRLGALDTRDGSVRWYDVPGTGPQGPHTLNADADGNLWVALEESYSLARFSTRTFEWRVYPPPPGVKFAITHDTAVNAARHVQPDAHGRLWMTLVGLNELWSVQTDTGEVRRFPMPLPAGEEQFHVFIYGAAMDPSLKRVWWTQLHGHLGSFDVETGKVEKVVPFPRGAAPRRMAIEDDGTLWVPLYGEGQLVKFDTARGVEIARYDMPDRAGASYSVTLDAKRRAVWVGTTNSDRIYRFDIDTARWRHYPLPRREAFLRMIEIDHATGDLWTAYANLPIGRRDPAIYEDASANNMIVRLHPGD